MFGGLAGLYGCAGGYNTLGFLAIFGALLVLRDLAVGFPSGEYGGEIAVSGIAGFRGMAGFAVASRAFN